MRIKNASAGLVAALLFAALAHDARAGEAKAGDNDPVAIPAALEVPAGQVLTLTARGVGVQIYACAAGKGDPTQYSWTLKGPEAELRDPSSGKPLGRHYAGPAWEAGDGSKVTGELVAAGDAPEPGAIPWLLLRAKSTSGAGVFSHIVSIQRLRTVGGKAPASGCDPARAGEETRVPYSAEYRFYAPQTASPVGLWKTIDDKTGMARALVRIYEDHGRLFGRIEDSFTNGADRRVCVPCTDERKDQPIIGLLIIRNIKANGGEYDGGDILDPESGSVYRCNMHLEQGGTRLVLRGYIGFSLLGRSQTWQRQG
jgi:uncharacterized protein (DUF2147 family)